MTEPPDSEISAETPQGSGAPSEFAGMSDLEAWASSSFGGGMVNTLPVAELEVFVAERMHTSGAMSSELALYVEQGDALRLVRHMPTVWGSRYRCDVHDSVLFIVVERQGVVVELLEELRAEDLQPEERGS